MPETTLGASQPSEDLSSIQIRRVGVFALLAAAALSEGCTKRQPVGPPSPRTEEAVRVDPLFAESDRAFAVGVRMGKESLVYFKASGRHASYFAHTLEFSVDEPGAKVQGGLEGWDVSVSDKTKPLPFTMNEFEAWRESQMADLLNKPAIKEMLTPPGYGILFSTDGSLFLTFLNGDRIELKQLEERVKPLTVLPEE